MKKLPHTQTIAADINTFKRMAGAVSFAVEVAENLQALEAQASDLKREIADSEKKRDAVKADVEQANANLANTKQKAIDVTNRAEEDAARIVADASTEAKEIKAKAQERADKADNHVAELQGRIEALGGEVKELEGKKAAAQKDLDRISGNLKSALSTVGGS